MVRTLTGYAIIGLIGLVALKLLLGVIGFAFSLLCRAHARTVVSDGCFMLPIYMRSH